MLKNFSFKTVFRYGLSECFIVVSTYILNHNNFDFKTVCLWHQVKFIIVSRYGLSNCLFAATYEEIVRSCRCVPFFHTLAYNDVEKIWFKLYFKTFYSIFLFKKKYIYLIFLGRKKGKNFNLNFLFNFCRKKTFANEK